MKASGRSIVFALAFGLSLFCASQELGAESRNVLGLLFHVDEIVRVDRSNVKVTLFGKSVILPESDLDSYVVDQYLREARAVERFEIDRLQVFVESAFDEGKIEWAALGLSACLRHKENNPETSLSFIEKLSKSEHAPEIFKKVLGTLEPVDWERLYTYEMLLQVGKSDSAWIRVNVAREVFRHSSSVMSFLSDRFIQASANEKLSEAEEITNLVGELFGERDSRYEKFKVALSKVSQALSAKSGEELFPLLRAAEGDPFLSRVLQPILRKAIHSSARALIQQKEAAEALAVLSQVPIEERSPETHQLIVKALQLLAPDIPLFSFDLPVAVMLREVSRSDQQVQEAYMSYLLRQAERSIDKNDFLQAESSLDEMQGVLPNSPLSSQLRFRLAKSWLDSGATERSHRVMDPYRSSLTLAQKGALLFRGYYLDINLLVLLSTIPIILLWLGIIRLRASWDSRIENPEEMFIPPSQEGEMGDFRQQFRQMSGDPEFQGESESFAETVKHGLNPRMHEYRSLLKKFGLGQNASSKQIKAAYRAAVKEVHPDVQAHKDQEDTRDVFIRMTSAYERILELRKSLQLKDE
ncbi:MAG: J domain-containing protein [Bdellovibrionales bacterium]|nr:J domain-containing protein [Bdellovibrionales bacterium]